MDVHSARAIGKLAEPLLPRDVARGRSGISAVIEQVVAGDALHPRREGAEEEQPIANNRTADRSAELVAVIRLPVVLNVKGRSVRNGIEHQTPDRGRAQSAALVVVV